MKRLMMATALVELMEVLLVLLWVAICQPARVLWVPVSLGGD